MHSIVARKARTYSQKDPLVVVSRKMFRSPGVHQEPRRPAGVIKIPDDVSSLSEILAVAPAAAEERRGRRRPGAGGREDDKGRTNRIALVNSPYFPAVTRSNLDRAAL